MKNYLVLITFLMFNLSFQLPTNIEKVTVEIYHVMATNGLNMRDKPNGKKIVTIPYNGEIERLDSKSYGTLKIEEIKGFFIEGDWVKVRYDGKEGYVFGGYLTQFPLPKAIGEEIDYEKYNSTFDYYLQTNFKSTTEKYNISKENYDCKVTPENDCVCGYSQEFTNNIFYKNQSCTENSGEEYMELVGATMAEVYFIIVAMDVNGLIQHPSDERNDSTTYNKSLNEIIIEADGAGCYPTIRQRRKNSVEVSMWCGC